MFFFLEHSVYIRLQVFEETCKMYIIFNIFNYAVSEAF